MGYGSEIGRNEKERVHICDHLSKVVGRLWQEEERRKGAFPIRDQGRASTGGGVSRQREEEGPDRFLR